MELQDKELLINALKRTPLKIPQNDNIHLDYRRNEIEKILPHRGSFALLDQVTLLNLDTPFILANSLIKADNPVFKDHFPGHPIYPGVLQIEMMGQAGLCLIYFLKNSTAVIDEKSKPVKGLFTRIHNAGFNHPVLPNDHLEVRASMLEYDDFLGIMQVQIWKNEVMCSHSILEAYLMEDDYEI